MGESASITTLPVEPVASIDEARARMRAIAGILPPTDGLACFNRMYLIVTEAVRKEVAGHFFEDAAFMTSLDVTFANRYLAAIRAYRRAPDSAPRAWRVLLDNRSDPDIAPMQFALAGMNAHINYDLAPAVTETCEQLKTEPDHGTHHADFEKVNTTLATLDSRIRESFEEGVLLDLDRRFAGLEDVMDAFSITAARETAWVNAQVLWRLRGESLLATAYLDALDRGVAFAGRALLIRLAQP